MLIYIKALKSPEEDNFLVFQLGAEINQSVQKLELLSMGFKCNRTVETWEHCLVDLSVSFHNAFSIFSSSYQHLWCFTCAFFFFLNWDNYTIALLYYNKAWDQSSNHPSWKKCVCFCSASSEYGAFHHLKCFWKLHII